MGVLTYLKDAGTALIVAMGISLSYVPDARSQSFELTEEAAEMLKQRTKEALEKGVKAIVGFNRIVANALAKLDSFERLSSEYLRQETRKETAKMMLEGYGPEIFYLEDKCYLPAKGIEKLLEERPDEALRALEQLENKTKSPAVLHQNIKTAAGPWPDFENIHSLEQLEAKLQKRPKEELVRVLGERLMKLYYKDVWSIDYKKIAGSDLLGAMYQNRLENLEKNLLEVDNNSLFRMLELTQERKSEEKYNSEYGVSVLKNYASFIAENNNPLVLESPAVKMAKEEMFGREQPSAVEIFFGEHLEGGGPEERPDEALRALEQLVLLISQDTERSERIMFGGEQPLTMEIVFGKHHEEGGPEERPDEVLRALEQLDQKRPKEELVRVLDERLMKLYYKGVWSIDYKKIVEPNLLEAMYQNCLKYLEKNLLEVDNNSLFRMLKLTQERESKSQDIKRPKRIMFRGEQPSTMEIFFGKHHEKGGPEERPDEALRAWEQLVLLKSQDNKRLEPIMFGGEQPPTMEIFFGKHHEKGGNLFSEEIRFESIRKAAVEVRSAVRSVERVSKPK